MSHVYLILENGAVFKGRPFGYDGEVVGELVFSTCMTGYLKTLSDPSYYGQIVLQTFPLIGNYGVIRRDFGPGPVHLRAYIVRDWCQEPSNFRSEGNLDSFLREMKTPGLFGVDTRALTRIIRENGTMNAVISKTAELSEAQWQELRGYRVTDAVAAVAELSGKWKNDGGTGDGDADIINTTEPSPCVINTTEPSPCVAPCVVWDFGGASRLTGGLIACGFAPTIVGYDVTADDIITLNPDGVVLSGGPGDPAENTKIIDEIKKLCSKKVPILAVGLGHQMLAIANGAKTGKLPFGHRGANQPVKDLASGEILVTSQNHGYTVLPESLPATSEVSFVNINDGACEGLEYKDMPAFSVQFDPEEEIYRRFSEVLRGGNA